MTDAFKTDDDDLRDVTSPEVEEAKGGEFSFSPQQELFQSECVVRVVFSLQVSTSFHQARKIATTAISHQLFFRNCHPNAMDALPITTSR